MEMPRNSFKRRLNEPGTQYGIWVSLADPVAAEICAGAGFDWLLIDAEHSPNELRTIMQQLQAVAPYSASPIVRPVRGEASIIKQYLDLGAQTLLIPMVESAAQASDLVRAMRYPPHGIRGVASARSARWGRVDDYWSEANDEACLIVQIESLAGLENLEAIAAVDGVDGLFVGPSDLGAALGYLGDANNLIVKQAVKDALHAIRATGKAAGVLGATPELAEEYGQAGATFVAVAVDTAVLARSTEALAARFKGKTERS